MRVLSLALVLSAALTAATGGDRAWVTAPLSASARRVAVRRAVLSSDLLGPSEPAEAEPLGGESKAPVLKRVLAFLGFFAFWGSRSDAAQAEETFAAAAATAAAVDASGLMTGEALAGATVGAFAGRAMAKETAAPKAVPAAATALVETPTAHAATALVEPPAADLREARADLEQLCEELTAEESPAVEEPHLSPQAVAPAPVAEAVDPAAEAGSERPPLTAPGMEDANLVVAVTTDPKMTSAASKQAGVELLMRQPSATILGLMAQDGWQVNEVDVEAGVFEVLMPAVEYDMPLGTVSIVPPLFRCDVRDSAAKDGTYQERLIGDLVLENGDGLLSVELNMGLFSRTFSISAAGWARCWLGGEGDEVRMKADVEIGLQVPKVPGLTQVMEFFVRTYANNSTKDCTVALAKGADHLRG